MRKLWWSATVIAVALCALAALTGCAGKQAAVPVAARISPPPGGGFAIELPRELPKQSAAVHYVHGNEYQQGWPHSRVRRVFDLGRYSPQYTPEHRALGDAAYALYAFNVLEYEEDQILHLYFANVGAQHSAWVGVPDYTKGRWDWFLLDDPVQYHSQIVVNPVGRSLEGVMPVAVVFLSDQIWELSSMYIGLTAEPGAWPMAGHDSRGSFGTDSIGAQSPNLLWEYQTFGPGLALSFLATTPAGELLVGTGDYLMCFNTDGQHLWTCNGVTPNTGIIFGPDGTIYVGGRWPNSGLHAITPAGKIKWTILYGQDIYSTPFMGPDGNLYFCTDSGYVYCFSTTGAQVKRLRLVRPSRITPGVSSSGQIYVAYGPEDVLSDKGCLASISPAGDLTWEIKIPNPARNQMRATQDGGVVYTTKFGDLVCINADGTERWLAPQVSNAYNWPIIGQDGTIYSMGGAINAFESSGEQKWSATFGGTGLGAPVLLPNGHLSGCTQQGKVFECDSEGTLLWAVELGREVFIPAAALTGVVFVGDIERELHAVNTDGSLRWQGGAGGSVFSSPVVDSEGTVYFGSEDSYLYALWPDGRLKWRYKTGGGISSSPLIGYDGTIYVCSKDGLLHALDAGGSQLWTFATGNLIESSPMQDDYGFLYFGSHDYYFYSLTSSGALRWRYLTAWNVTATPAVEKDGTVYFGSWDQHVYCLDYNGELQWDYYTCGPVKGSVTFDEDHVYCAAEDTTLIGRIYALHKDTGEKDWSYISGGPMQMGPALGADGLVYAASNQAENLTGGTIYACFNDALQWAYPAPNCGRGVALDRNRVLYAGSRNGKVLALQDSAGGLNVLWTYERPGAVFYTPAIAAGRLYIGCDMGIVALGDS